MFSHVPGSSVSVCVAAVWEDRHHHEGPPLVPLSHLLLLRVAPHGMEYPFGWFRAAALVMSPPHVLPIPSLMAICGGHVWRES